MAQLYRQQHQQLRQQQGQHQQKKREKKNNWKWPTEEEEEDEKRRLPDDAKLYEQLKGHVVYFLLFAVVVDIVPCQYVVNLFAKLWHFCIWILKLIALSLSLVFFGRQTFLLQPSTRAYPIKEEVWENQMPLSYIVKWVRSPSRWLPKSLKLWFWFLLGYCYCY